MRWKLLYTKYSQNTRQSHDINGAVNLPRSIPHHRDKKPSSDHSGQGLWIYALFQHTFMGKGTNLSHVFVCFRRTPFQTCVRLFSWTAQTCGCRFSVVPSVSKTSLPLWPRRSASFSRLEHSQSVWRQLFCLISFHACLEMIWRPDRSLNSVLVNELVWKYFSRAAWANDILGPVASLPFPFSVAMRHKKTKSIETLPLFRIFLRCVLRFFHILFQP